MVHHLNSFSLTLFRLNTFQRVALISGETLAHALPSGRSELIFEEDPDGQGTISFGPICGFAALAGEAVVSTSGLRWNLTNELLKMGALISSSNELMPAVIPDSLSSSIDSLHAINCTDTKVDHHHQCLPRVVTLESSTPIYWMCTIKLKEIES
jgi:thiamine pyrophosphokinase